MTDEAQLTSPRIQRLRREMESRGPAAVDLFWDEVEAATTPLVEAIPDDDTDVLVTFVWRGDLDTKSVRVWHDDMLGTTPAEAAMLRLGETNVWHKTFRLASALRFEYVFYPNDPELDDEPLPSPETYEVALRLDPLNPKRYLLPDDGEHPEWNDFFGGWSSWVKREQSLAELPAALPQPWVAERADVAKGIVDKHRFESATLGNTRAVYVYTSPGYDATSESTWLLILFDAWSYRAIIPMPTILDNLVADGDIPPLAAVLVDHPSFDERMRELSFEEPGPAFETAVADEVMPWIGERYRVASDARRVIIGGASNGADAAARIAVAHPELFGNVLSQSGTYGRSPSGDTEPEWLARWIAELPRLPIRFHLEAGTMESDPGRSGVSILQSNRHLRTVLRARDYDVHLVEFSGGHQMLCWQGTIRDALMWLMSAGT